MNRLQLFGIVVFVAGIILPLGYGLYHFFIAEDIPVLIRASSSLLFVGLIIVIISLVRERLQDLKKGR